MAEKDHGLWTDRPKMAMGMQNDPMRFWNLFNEVGTPLQAQYIESRFFPPNQLKDDDKHSELDAARRRLVALNDPMLASAIAAIDEQLAALATIIQAQNDEKARLAADEEAAAKAQAESRAAYQAQLQAEAEAQVAARKEAADEIIQQQIAAVEAQKAADAKAAADLAESQRQALEDQKAKQAQELADSQEKARIAAEAAAKIQAEADAEAAQKALDDQARQAQMEADLAEAERLQVLANEEKAKHEEEMKNFQFPIFELPTAQPIVSEIPIEPNPVLEPTEG